jgi:hypothetical protein
VHWGLKSAGSVAAAGCGVVLLRVVPGEHTAFEENTRESAFKLAFLLESVAANLCG